MGNAKPGIPNPTLPPASPNSTDILRPRRTIRKRHLAARKKLTKPKLPSRGTRRALGDGSFGFVKFFPAAKGSFLVLGRGRQMSGGFCEGGGGGWVWVLRFW